MTEGTPAAPVAETTTTPQATTTTAVTAPAATTPAATPAAQPTTAPSAPVNVLPVWASNRIDALTRQLREAQEKSAETEARLAALSAPPAATSAPQRPTAPGPTTPAVDVNQQAMRLAATMRFNEKCDEIYRKGVGEFSDFDSQLKTFAQLGGLPPPLVEAAIELGDAHKVLYNLSRDPVEAQRIMALSPAAQAAALAKVALGPGRPSSTVSNAPPPIAPRVGGGGTAPNGELSANQDMNEWIRVREAQVKAARQH